MIEIPLRERHDLSLGWEFARGRVSRRWLQGRGSSGEAVDLPHCWNRGDTFQHGRHSYSGRGAYRRSFDLPDSPRGPGHWRLRSEGFYGVGDLWFDGQACARFDGQYLGFGFDIPGSLPAGRHALAIRLDNVWRRTVLPGRRDPDFLLYGGLACRIWIEWVPLLHLDAGSVEVVCASDADGSEVLELRCAVNGPEASRADARVRWTVTSADGVQVAATGTSPIITGSTSSSAVIRNPRCWSPDDPQLYWAECRLETDAGVVDVVRVRFGITRAEFRPNTGLFLNGCRFDLHGCNRHESIPGFGNALPEELHRADARLLKLYGCNFVRLSHYPQHPAFLDACDELGVLVYAEIASWKSVSSSSRWRRAARRQMRDLLIRDRHHPSVIIWGMGNESRSRPAYLELREIARELDPARPVTYAENHLHRARRQKTVGISDVWSVNYELDILEEARDACRLRNVIASECCNFPLTVKGDDGAELIQVSTLEYEWRMMADKPYLAGHAVWCFADYATEYRRRFRRQAGLFDAWRRPKMAAELFRARYSEEPFISIFVTQTGDDERDLHIFSNCETIRLERDDAPAVELAGAPHHTVSLEGAFTGVRAEGFRVGATVRRELRPWGPATAVMISIDETAVDAGRTVAVDLTICDAAETPVQNWNGQVVVDVDGDARLFPYSDSGEVVIARGEGRTYLQFGHSGEDIMVRAVADGLTAAAMRMTPIESHPEA